METWAGLDLVKPIDSWAGPDIGGSNISMGLFN